MSTKEDLKSIYQALKGEEFEGTYEGEYSMPQTGKERVVLSIDASSALGKTLSEISSEVLETYGQTVWKGITGPEDSSRYTDYWLWAEPAGLSEVLEEDDSYNFTIAKCTPFECSGGTFSYGVSIKVKKLSQ